MSSRNFLKFGVEFNGDGQLFTLECPAVYDDIIYNVSRQFGIPESEISNYCLRKSENSGTTEYYTTEENCRLKTGDVVQLVEIPSKAVEKFISSLNQALVHLFNKSTTTNTTASNLCNPSHQSYDSFKQILIELVIVLQCKQFIKDFVKCEGHCKLFQLVEIIDKVDKSFHDEIWTHLLACLVELSKHAITNQLPNDNDATIVDNNSSHRDSFYPQEDFCFTLNNDDYIMHSSDEITILKHDNEKVDDQTIKYSPTILPRSIHATEFFSWQLVSDQFLSVIIEHCRKETKLDCLLNEMKLLLKITTDYPVHIPYVIKQTGQGFILDLLKIIQLNITGPKSSTNSNSVHSEMLRCEIQNLIMKFLYVIFYYGKQQGRLVCLIHQFLENVQFIEWIPELRNQLLWKSMVTSYYPKKHQSDYSMTTLNPFSLFVNDASDENAENKFVLKYLEDFSNFLENDSCCKTEYNNNNNNMIIHGSSSDNVGQQQRQCNSSHRLANDSIHATFNNDSSNKQSSIHLLSSLCRVQQIANSLLVTRMNTPLDPTSEENIEKMNQLCSAVYFDEYANNPTVEAIEEACIKLGFTIPTDPYADFKKPPGILGFQCIYFYIMKNRTKLTDMLNYSYPRQKQVYSPTNYCKLNYLSEFNLSSSSNVNSNFDARGNSQRIQRHFSTVDSNHMQKMLLHTSPGVQHQQQRNNNTGRRFTVDSLTPANLPQSFNKPNRECDSSSQSFLYNYSIPSSTSSTSTISYIDKKPLFPIIEAANAVTNMLYELITTSDTIHEPYFITEQDDKDFYLPSLFYPILLSHNNQFNNSTFENLFDCVFSIFFYSWTQMKAVPEDLIAIVCVVREQINRILQTVPISFEEFEKSLATFNPYDVPSMWSKRENRLRVSMLNNHPALIELRNSLRKSHQGHVYENRLNILSNSAPLEYNPPKGSKLCSKDNQSFTVLLSTDRKSLVIRDINQTIREIWPLNCVSRVSLGIMEKVKKNPERTLLLQLELSDTSNQDDPNESLTNKSRFLRVSLLARSIIEYNYWLDGLFLLNKLNNPSDYYNEDVERLTDLDMRIRLSSLDLNQLPKREIQIPPDPPPLDFI